MCDVYDTLQATKQHNHNAYLVKNIIRRVCFNFYIFVFQAVNQKMVGTKYAWIILGYYSDLWWRKNDTTLTCTTAQLRRALEGFIGTDVLTLSTSVERTVSKLVRNWDRKSSGSSLASSDFYVLIYGLVKENDYEKAIKEMIISKIFYYISVMMTF